MRPWGFFALLVVAACSASGTKDPDPLTDDPGAGGKGGQAAGASGTSGAAGGGVILPDGGPDPTGCGDVGRVIFVVSNENMLLSFDPKTLAFSKIGALKCPVGFGDSPFSMAVDRTGMAFVLFQSGNIYKVSTTDASCSASGYKPSQLGWDRFGMGYVSDAAGSESETLFVIDGSNIGGGANKGLGKISSAGLLSSVGQFDMGLAGRTAEVTGLGDGRLFAFFVGDSGSSVAEIDKGTGKVVSNEPQALPSISAWAFAHWGGSFYLFNGDGGPSKVHKYTPGKGTTQVVADAGYSIVGAGVSTCAPTTEIVKLALTRASPSGPAGATKAPRLRCRQGTSTEGAASMDSETAVPTLRSSKVRSPWASGASREQWAIRARSGGGASQVAGGSGGQAGGASAASMAASSG